MTGQLDTLLRDVAAQLADTGALTREQRLRRAFELVAARSTLPITVLELRCAVFSRSALFHLGGAMVPASAVEALQFREQARGGFVELGSSMHPHVVLQVGDFALDLVHSSEWRDRGVWIRPFVSRITSPAWVVDRLPFGVQVAYLMEQASSESAAAIAS